MVTSHQWPKFRHSMMSHCNWEETWQKTLKTYKNSSKHLFTVYFSENFVTSHRRSQRLSVIFTMTSLWPHHVLRLFHQIREMTHSTLLRSMPVASTVLYKQVLYYIKVYYINKIAIEAIYAFDFCNVVFALLYNECDLYLCSKNM